MRTHSFFFPSSHKESHNRPWLPVFLPVPPSQVAQHLSRVCPTASYSGLPFSQRSVCTARAPLVVIAAASDLCCESNRTWSGGVGAKCCNTQRMGTAVYRVSGTATPPLKSPSLADAREARPLVTAVEMERKRRSRPWRQQTKELRTCSADKVFENPSPDCRQRSLPASLILSQLLSTLHTPHHVPGKAPCCCRKDPLCPASVFPGSLRAPAWLWCMPQGDLDVVA